jgi:hypothetical protein
MPPDDGNAKQATTRLIIAALLTAGSFVMAQSWRELLSLSASRSYNNLFCRSENQRRSLECQISIRRQESVPAPVLVFEAMFTTFVLAVFIASVKHTMGGEFTG